MSRIAHPDGHPLVYGWTWGFLRALDFKLQTAGMYGEVRIVKHKGRVQKLIAIQEDLWLAGEVEAA